jgi:hypothetical protein
LTAPVPLLVCSCNLFPQLAGCQCNARPSFEVLREFGLPNQHILATHFALFRSFILASLLQLSKKMTDEDLVVLKEHWEQHDQLGQYLDTQSYTPKCHLECAHAHTFWFLISDKKDHSIERSSTVHNTWCFTSEKAHIDAKNCLTNNHDDSVQRIHHVNFLWAVELEHTNNWGIDAVNVK